MAPSKTKKISPAASHEARKDPAYRVTKAPSSQSRKFGAVPTVTLYVDTAKIPFQVHRDILCDASPIFNAAFTGNFKEKSKRSMNLPDDDADSFERIVQWLYSKTYDLHSFPEEPCDEDQLGYLQLASLYVAADKYGILPLKNDVMDKWCKIHEKIHQPPGIEIMEYVYLNTTAKSKLRKLIIAYYVWDIDYDWYQAEATGRALCDHAEFTRDVALAMALRIKNHKQDPFMLGSINFYEESVGIGGTGEMEEST